MFNLAQLKRENWNHHYKVVARDKKGHILSHIRYTKQTSIKELYGRYNDRGTFSLSKRRISEKTSTFEHIKPISRRGLRHKYGIIASIQIKGYGVITARSRILEWPDIGSAKSEAAENLYYKISEVIYGTYDADDGLEFYNQQSNSIYYSYYYYD